MSGASIWRTDRLTATDIDGAVVLPLDQLLARLLEHPGADGDDEPGLLGQGDELVGADQAPLGVLPAHERLGADHALPVARSTIGW